MKITLNTNKVIETMLHTANNKQLSCKIVQNTVLFDEAVVELAKIRLYSTRLSRIIGLFFHKLLAKHIV